MTNGTFIDNAASSEGGAVYAFTQNRVDITNSKFVRNSAQVIETLKFWLWLLTRVTLLWICLFELLLNFQLGFSLPSALIDRSSVERYRSLTAPRPRFQRASSSAMWRLPAMEARWLWQTASLMSRLARSPTTPVRGQLFAARLLTKEFVSGCCRSAVTIH